ncbi:ATP phosphoribosyltransferase regulatory subunit [Enterovirga aerilata]|uniref:ATP phosphoribosyltransferase regulatory subunit n=1 Tax=Enterovirga aerilata TaxID=2730920 RepID=A0A849I499_9HYPH|nr:ATP phosphoribosyltransferase regulatory subunit [Enterovirga sp. DB1703]NNM72161.1 ATP phosphoribosyltransferase regulatory subunit [Enterovirga sp. DB1703]
MIPSVSAHDELVRLFARRGSTLVDTPILQPAALFLELSGESIRRRLFVTQDGEGREFCLRPEHTIPVCVAHVRSGRDAGEYCYLGPVFRQRAGEPSEFLQAGVESIGNRDAAAADAEVFALAMAALDLYGRRGVEVRIGDMGLLEAVLDALAVAPAARRRLVRQLSAGRGIEAALAEEPRPAGADYAGLLGAIEGQDPRAAKAFVEDVISIAGISAVGGRSAAEIAERFLSRAANRSGGLAGEAREVLRRYLAIRGDPGGAARAMRELARGAGLDLGPALGRFEARCEEMARRGVPLDGVTFAADSARNMDYYTGFIFEMRDSAAPPGRFLVAGGRYDRLLEQLGAAAPMPAVGCSFWLDRLAGGAA